MAILPRENGGGGTARPAFARAASYGGFVSAEARSAKPEGRWKGRRTRRCTIVAAMLPRPELVALRSNKLNLRGPLHHASPQPTLRVGVLLRKERRSKAAYAPSPASAYALRASARLRARRSSRSERRRVAGRIRTRSIGIRWTLTSIPQRGT